MKLIAAVIFALTTTALAQLDTPLQPEGQPSNKGSPPVVGAAVLGVEVTELAVVATGYRVAKLLRQPVYNDENEKIGKVEDFIVTPDGTLSYAIIDVGGFLGMGAHRVAIPTSQFTDVTPRIVLPGATKAALKQMPEFRYSRDHS